MAQETEPSRLPSVATPLWRLRPGKLLFVFLPLLLLLALNTTDDWMPLLEHESACGSLGAGISGPDEFFYHHLQMRHGHRPSRRVTLVTIGEAEGSDLLTNVCVGRRFTADLLDALGRQDVQVIALDKVYGEKSCKDGAANQALVAAVEQSHASIVVGQGTHFANGAETGACLIDTPSFPFGRAAVAQGITKVNEDDRKIPLAWPVFQNDAAVAGGKSSVREGKGFALLAAEAADPGIAAETQLVRNEKRHSHPFGDFREAIDEVSASRVLCSDAAGAAAFAHWGGQCGQLQPTALRGRVVVVANQSDRDMQPFVDGEIPGAMLQAHYVAALLSGSYISELPFWGCFIAFAIWLLGTELWLVATRDNAKTGVLWSITGIFLAVSVLLIVGLQMMDVMPPVSFLLAALVILLFDWTSELLARGRKRAFGA